MPRPLKTEWYSPEKTWLTRPRVLISICRTFLRSSRVSMGITVDIRRILRYRVDRIAMDHGTSILFRISCTTCSEVTSSASAS